MNRKLRLEDRHAADLLLDRMATAAAGNGKALYAGANAALRPRVQRLAKMLSLLDAAPIADPPHDLISRTLERVDFAGHCQSDQTRVDLGNHSRPVA
jgi:hypothetical protein